MALKNVHILSAVARYKHPYLYERTLLFTHAAHKYLVAWLTNRRMDGWTDGRASFLSTALNCLLKQLVDLSARLFYYFVVFTTTQHQRSSSVLRLTGCLSSIVRRPSSPVERSQLLYFAIWRGCLWPVVSNDTRIAKVNLTTSSNSNKNSQQQRLDELRSKYQQHQQHQHQTITITISGTNG